MGTALESEELDAGGVGGAMCLGEANFLYSLVRS